jgi:SAM-dependent methyltransferase
MKSFDKLQDYEEYKNSQIKRHNAKKPNKSPLEAYVDELNGLKLCQGAKILCNGVRNANETNIFKSLYPHCTVVGTDIATAESDIVCCDFSMLPKEWSSSFDLVYSNSLDHALDVAATLREWRRVMKDGAMLVLRLSICGKVDAADRHSFEEEDIELFESCGFKTKDNRFPIIQMVAV